MRFLVIGYGAMGKRHAANLRVLMPEAPVLLYDPALPGTSLAEADAVIIATPEATHAAYMQWCCQQKRPLPFFVEKPLGTTMLPVASFEYCTIGFNYRFHKEWDRIVALAQHGVLKFTTHTSLLSRYGATVGGTVASHAIDMALCLLGPPEEGGIHLASDTIRLSGSIMHKHGESFYEYDMDAAHKMATIGNDTETISLMRDEECYLAEMQAWGACLQGNGRDARLATIEDGVAVEYCLERIVYHP